MLIVEVEAGFCGLRADKGINNDDTRIAFNKGNIGNITAADLIHAFGDFKQAGNTVDLRLPPQAGVHRVGAGALISNL